jgi:hypothetical protein
LHVSATNEVTGRVATLCASTINSKARAFVEEPPAFDDVVEPEGTEPAGTASATTAG